MSFNTAALINLLGFTIGAVLYAMLLAMVLRHPAGIARGAEPNAEHAPAILSANGLLLATAILGLLWNIGALATNAARDLGVGEPSPSVVALSFAALGFLPAVIVHSALRSYDAGELPAAARWIKLAAYLLSAAACVMHFYDALSARPVPSNAALRTLTVGYLILIVVLFLTTRRRQGWERAVWASALAVFAVSALHLSQHPEGGTERWSVELLGHHASLPLALAILYQDYRFAFADIFLKRALSMLLVVALAFSLYVSIVAPLLAMRDARGQVDPRAVGVLLALWVVTALLYPALRRAANHFVDRVVLRRAEYVALKAEVARLLATHESTDAIHEDICRLLAPALSAREVRWLHAGDAEDASEKHPQSSTHEDSESAHTNSETGSASSRAANSALLLRQLVPRLTEASQDGHVSLLERDASASAVVFVPTAEPPFYWLLIGPLSGGRRLLSDDISLLDTVATLAARRVDALRVTHERCEQLRREQEMGKLATEAQLRALRAQVNPHFLFNALTTIGYLIKPSPDRALDTLLKLTDLLRRVLRSTGEFATLGEELKLIAAYLDIERERFEERLRVSVDVPTELLSLKLPSLLVQPLVENAIKHGIAPARLGGEVTLSARLEREDGDRNARGDTLSIKVRDTGVGASEIELARGRRRGVGLSNVEERLRSYCGQAGSLSIQSAPGAGTTVELRLPVASISGRADAQPAVAVVTANAGERRGA